MTDFRELAKQHAARGYFVFPAQPNKRPVEGFMSWEQQATADPAQIDTWWRDFPDSIPAVAPGVTGNAVIDVDRHDGSADGFVSLRKENIIIPPEAFGGTSLSGNGQHFWFRADVGSLNGVIPGVDRKARGGYVIVPYDLPPAIDIRTLLPESLSGGRLHASTVRNFMTPEQLDYWLKTVGSGPISAPMYEIISKFQGTGNQQMSVNIARIVRLAAKGESGAAKALDEMLGIWVNAPHSTGDPEEEFHVNTRSAIEKFGEPISEDALVEHFWTLARGDVEFKFNRADLAESFLVYCDRKIPDWRADETTTALVSRCLVLIPHISTPEDLERWQSATKELITKRIKGS